jgi:hypothetical protein
MDPLVTLKKKLSTYVSEAGRIRNVSDELLFELVTTWETWPGTGAEFYRAIGFTGKQMAKLIGKAKKLKREGHFGSANFKEVVIDGLQELEVSGTPPRTGGVLIELDRGKGVVIRFPHVGQLVEFLKLAG